MSEKAESQIFYSPPYHGANKADAADDGPYAAHVVTTDKTEQTEQRVRERAGADGAGVSVASGGRKELH